MWTIYDIGILAILLFVLGNFSKDEVLKAANMISDLARTWIFGPSFAISLKHFDLRETVVDLN